MLRELRRKKEELGHMIEKRSKCQEEKEMLEFELMKAQFRLDHLPYRKEMAATDTSMRMVFLVPLIIIVVNYIIVFIKMVHYINKGELDRANGFTLLIAAVVVPFGAILIFRLFRQQYSNMGSFFKLGNLFNNMGTDTFEEDRQKTLKQISSLLTKISDLEEDIDQQREQEKKFRVEIERYKESLIEAGLFDARELQKSKSRIKKHTATRLLSLS